MNSFYKHDAADYKVYLQDYLRMHVADFHPGRNFRCPNTAGHQHGDQHPSMHYYADTYVAHCFACRISWDIYQFVRCYEGIEKFSDQVARVVELFGGKAPPDKGKKPPRKQDDRPEPKLVDPAFYEQARADMEKGGHQYLASRGISKDTADMYGVGYCAAWRPPNVTKRVPAKPVVIFPGRTHYSVRDVRRDDDIPDNAKPYIKQKIGRITDFFGERWLYETGICFIVEGEIDALSIFEAGAPALALGSVSHGERFIQLLRQNPPGASLVIALDNDKAGQDTQRILMASLSRMGIPNIALDMTMAPHVNGKPSKDVSDWLRADKKSLKAAIQLNKEAIDALPPQMKKSPYHDDHDTGEENKNRPSIILQDEHQCQIGASGIILPDNSFLLPKDDSEGLHGLLEASRIILLGDGILPSERDSEGLHGPLEASPVILPGDSFLLPEDAPKTPKAPKVGYDPLDNLGPAHWFYDEGSQRLRFAHDVFGNYIIREHNIIRINREPYYYRNGIYISNKGDYYGQIGSFMSRALTRLRTLQQAEAYRHICQNAPECQDIAGPHLIPFTNGYYNLDNDTLSEYDPSVIFLNQIPHRFNAEAPVVPRVDEFFLEVADGDMAIVQFLLEVIGYGFYRAAPYRIAIILLGRANCGKSTLLNFIRQIFGEENTASLSLHDMQDKFRPSNLYGKMINIGDDLSSKPIETSDTLRSCITGGKIDVERKYEQAFTFQNYAKFWCAANIMPIFKQS